MSRFTFGADAARCLRVWRKLGCWFVIGLTTVMSCAATSHAIQFAFDYSGDMGEGFNDPANGQMRRTALEFAANIWGALLPAAYPGETIGIRAVVNPIGDATSTTLASAASNLFFPNFGSSNPEYQTNTYYAQSLANHLKGSDLDPAQYEIGITFNSSVGVTGALADRAWYYGTDGVPPANTPTTFYRDFVTVALHEIGHGLGFKSFLEADGTFDASQQYPAIYDRFLTFGPGGAPLPEMSPSSRALALTSNSLFWDGDAGRAANGGMPVKMHAPTTYDDGSSTSHLDETTFPDSLLSPNYSGVLHVPGAIERGILRDMGWNVPIDVQWTGAGPNNAASTAANWSPNLPVAGDSLVFGNSPQTNVNFDLEIEAVGSLTFAAAAPSYTVTLRGWSDVEVNGVGVSNLSSNLQTIALEPGTDSNVAGASSRRRTAGVQQQRELRQRDLRGPRRREHPRWHDRRLSDVLSTDTQADTSNSTTTQPPAPRSSTWKARAAMERRGPTVTLISATTPLPAPRNSGTKGAAAAAISAGLDQRLGRANEFLRPGLRRFRDVPQRWRERVRQRHRWAHHVLE